MIASYIAGLTSPPPVIMQQYATLIQVKWSSQLLPTLPADPRVLKGTMRGFSHIGEVFALYIQYSLAQGGLDQRLHHTRADPDSE